jgi:hypothetical protein
MHDALASERPMQVSGFDAMIVVHAVVAAHPSLGVFEQHGYRRHAGMRMQLERGPVITKWSTSTSGLIALPKSVCSELADIAVRADRVRCASDRRRKAQAAGRGLSGHGLLRFEEFWAEHAEEYS